MPKQKMRQGANGRLLRKQNRLRSASLLICHFEGIFLSTRRFLPREKRFLLNDKRGGARANNISREVVWMLLVFSCAISHAQTAPRYTLLNINNLTTWLRSDGQSSHSPKNDAGTRFPRGTGNVIYQDGIMWGGKAYLDSARTMPASSLRRAFVGGSHYNTSCRVGRVLGFGANAVAADPNAPGSRVYRIRRDYYFMSEAEWRNDAAESFETIPAAVFAQQIETLKKRYEVDWREWPVAFGAPFIDRNRNGVYDPPPAFSPTFSPEDLITGGYDEPGVSNLTAEAPADQVLWTVYNDLGPINYYESFLAEPLGLEIQLTQWAYKSDGVLGNTFFRRARFLNKGGVERDSLGHKGAFWVDSMYVSQWSDPDLGYAGDDLVGCDTLLHLGYVYNGGARDSEFDRFQLAPPAAGYVLLQGPHVASLGDTAWFEERRIHARKNLTMTAFTYQSAGPPIGPPSPWVQTIYLYRMMRGLTPSLSAEQYYPFPPEMTPGPFPLSGDPVARRGFIDGLGELYSFAAWDRRFMLSSGPFTLAPGDTQEVVFAFVAALGADRLSSVTALKFYAKQLRMWYPYQAQFARGAGYQPPNSTAALPQYFSLAPNFPNPFSSLTFIDYTIAREAEVHLAIYDVLGREVKRIKHGRTVPGFYRAVWDGRDEQGNLVAHGVYFYKLRFDNYREVRHKLVLLR